MIGKRLTLGSLLALALVLSVPACASTPAPAAMKAGGAETICFNAMDITHLDPLPGRYLYIQVGNNDHYLLTLDRPSERLRLARNIQVSRDFPRVCSNQRVPLTYEYQSHVGVYNIIGIERVANRAEAESLAAKRTPPPADEK